MRALEQMLRTNSLMDWASATGVALAVLAGILIVKQIIIRQLVAYAQKPSTPPDDFVS